MTTTRGNALLIAAALAIVTACSGEPERDGKRDERPGASSPEGKLPLAPSAENPDAVVKKETEPRQFPERFDGPLERIAASNILVAYAGAEKASGSVTRSEQEARALATKLYDRIRAGESFEKLASEFSDGPEKAHGGRIGVFRTDKMLPQISSAALSLKFGEVAAPVESPYGFHIVRRDEVEEVFLAQILVSYKGSTGAAPQIERTEAEAEARAKEALAEAKKPGAEFGPVAGTYSDHPSKMVGGVMGPASRGLLPPELERLAFGLGQNEVGGPVKTAEGFVVLKRLEELHFKHILVAYKGAMRAPREVTRSKEEAQARIAEAYEKLKNGESFSAMALRYSDCPSRSRGGDLGKTARGMMSGKLEDAVLGLEVGGQSGIVPTEFGYHIVERLPL